MQTLFLIAYVVTVSGTNLENTLVEVFRKYAPSIQSTHNPLLIEQFSSDQQFKYAQLDLIHQVLLQLDTEMHQVQFDVRGKPSSNTLTP